MVRKATLTARANAIDSRIARDRKVREEAHKKASEKSLKSKHEEQKAKTPSTREKIKHLKPKNLSDGKSLKGRASPINEFAKKAPTKSVGTTLKTLRKKKYG